MTKGLTCLYAVMLISAGIPLHAQQNSKPAAHEKVTADQLAQRLAGDAGKGDAQVAADLSRVELTERLSMAQQSKLTTTLPGDKSRQALAILADSAILLPPPQAEIVDQPAPDAAALRQMLVLMVGYVNTTLKQLPNFVATRSITAFEDQPQVDVVDSLGTIGRSYQPLHMVGQSAIEVTYRDGHEVASDVKRTQSHSSGVRGLMTAGEFGPFLSTVLADAVKGKITWVRREQAEDGVEGVFHYEVPVDKSHYVVQFCCALEDYGSDGTPKMEVYHRVSGYHGEIAFDPASGAIRRITVEAEQGPGETVEKASMVVEYGTVQVSGRDVMLPTGSVSFLVAHTSPPTGGMKMASEKGPLKTFLNETRFENYHQFRGEMRILTGDAGTGGGSPDRQ